MTERTNLVVDDDSLLRQTLAEHLELDGYAVAQAANGSEALQLIERICPDVVLLDMRMPVLDGPGLVRVLESCGRKPPIVAMTTAPDARRWGEAVAADAYLAKPFETADLLDAIATALKFAAKQLVV